MQSAQIETPLGSMIAIADEQVLHLLEFVDCRGIERELELLRRKSSVPIVPGTAAPIKSIEKELKQYFDGKLSQFKTPISYMGTPFQESVWQGLVKIPYGQTRSYADVAIAIGCPTAHRAVANANARNQLAIVVPCHRVINSNGDLGGYGGKVERKQWLLDLEIKASSTRVLSQTS